MKKNISGMKTKPKRNLINPLPQSVLDAMPFQLAIINRHGIISRVNKAWINFALENNADPETRAGKGLDYLKVCRADRSHKGRNVVKGIVAVLAGEAAEFESEYPCHSQKQKRWFIMKVSPILPLGKGAVIAHFMITDRVLAEQALKKTNVELLVAKDAAIESEKTEAKFLAQMSHEIRTPLNGMFGKIEQIRDWKMDPSQMQVVETLDALVEHLLGVVNDILEFSKIEAGKLTLEEHAFDPGKMANGVRDMFIRVASAKGLELIWDIGPDFPERVSGDERRLRQILINLIGNALKFTERGSVSLSGRSVALDDGALQLMFAVKDTGIGIPAEEVQSLFQSFSQLKGGAAAGFSGTGLGLSISKYLAKAMGGDIVVKSIAGEGSTFTVTVQCKVSHDNSATVNTVSPQPGSVPVSGNGRILIVDDNEVNLKIMTPILEKAGWVTLLARDGTEAVAIWADHEVDAIFMDCQMPRLDGYGAAKEIRKKEAMLKRKRIPIVAVTADVMEENIKACRDAGMDEFLAKPYRKKDIAAIIVKLFGQGSPITNPE